MAKRFSSLIETLSLIAGEYNGTNERKVIACIVAVVSAELDCDTATAVDWIVTRPLCEKEEFLPGWECAGPILREIRDGA